MQQWLLYEEEELMKHTPNLKESLEEFYAFANRGKLYRGLQIVLSYVCNGGTDLEVAYKVAVAYELVCSSLLIQDDIMDSDYTRRGKETVFAAHKKVGEKLQVDNPLLYGQSIAILIGDIGFFSGTTLINASTPDAELNMKLSTRMAKELLIVASGQQADVIQGMQKNKELTENEIEYIYRYKTARYSVAGPLALGALAAGKDEQTIQKLTQAGEALGIIYQIKDDDNGLFQTEKHIGKPIGSDLRENKKTLYRSMLLARANQTQKENLALVFGNPDITQEDVIFVRNLVEELGVRSDINARMESLKNEAEETVQSLSLREPHRSTLLDFMLFLTTRTR